MMAWEPVEKYVRQENFNLGDNMPHRRVIQTEIIGRHVTMKDNDGVEMMNLLPQGYALCRQVPDGEVSVPVEMIRICTSYGMPLGITYAEYNAARDKVLAWLNTLKGNE